eukprot:1222852-Amphidinium_carterae.1
MWGVDQNGLLRFVFFDCVLTTHLTRTPLNHLVVGLADSRVVGSFSQKVYVELVHVVLVCLGAQACGFQKWCQCSPMEVDDVVDLSTGLWERSAMILVKPLSKTW